MGHRITDLYPSLVGSHTEFKISGEVATDIVEATVKKIELDLAEAKSSKGAISIYLMAEMVSYYKMQPYYKSVRSTIRLGRFSKEIQSWLDNSSKERVEEYIKMLGKKGTDRESLLKVIKYLLMGRSRYLKKFKSLLTREEYYDIT